MLSARPGKMWKSVRAPEKLGSDASSALQTLEQELLKAHLTLQIYRTLKQRALTQAKAGEIQQAAACVEPDAGPVRQFLGWPVDGVPHCARARWEIQSDLARCDGKPADAGSLGRGEALEVN